MLTDKQLSATVILFGKGVGEAFDLVPCATGEVRDLDRGVAVLHRDSSELGEATPFGHVIDIHV